MRRIYVDLINEMRSVVRFFDENPELLTEKPALSAAVETLRSRIAEIQELGRIQAVQTTHETVLKNESHDQLLVYLLKVKAGLVAHAAASNNTRLKMQVDISDSKLKKLPDSQFLPKANTILELGRALEAELSVWDVKPDDLTKLTNSLELYADKAPGLRTLKVRSIQATTEIRNKMDDTTCFLHDSLDAMMAPLKISNAKLYGEYLKARTPVKTSRGHGTRKSTDTPKTDTPTA